MTVETVVRSLDGWPPVTSLVRAGNAWWVVSIINTRWLRDAVAEASGMDLANPDDDAGHVEIYRATVEERPVIRPMPIDPDRSPDDPDLMPDDVHDVQVDVNRVITVVDADGDPLNGLTPAAVLPHGTTFDDAVAWIAESSSPDLDENGDT